MASFNFSGNTARDHARQHNGNTFYTSGITYNYTWNEPTQIRAAHRPEPSTLRKEDYTIGWICALPVPEWQASRLLFDAKHEDLVLPGSNFQYVYGEINRHNVVMGCLPSSQMGEGAAAAVASEMKALFTSLRFGLLVGIGGGVWSEEQDVRLGDVVVSRPDANRGNGGVVQYDYGKAIQGLGFQKTGTLNLPPLALLSAVGKLQSALPSESKFLHYLQSFQTFMTDLPQYSTRPPVDRLFQSSYTHLQGESTCRNCDDRKQISREDRVNDRPHVHYGTIASGNQVMKDAIRRDEIAERYDILCFEMEAAGLMNQFPCIVIRGICDYCDSHKNKAGQSWAAAVAAAFAKELLRNISPTEVVVSTATIAEQIAPIKTFTMIPYPRNEYFIGRSGIMEHLEQSLFATFIHTRVALEGRGGNGKSQIAIEYAYRVRKKMPHVHIFWIHASGPDRFYQDFRKITYDLELLLPNVDDAHVNHLQLVHDWLNGRKSGRWLLIIDNADEAEFVYRAPGAKSALSFTIFGTIPRKAGCAVILTSRNRQAAAAFLGYEQRHLLSVPEMTEEEALRLFRSRTSYTLDTLAARGVRAVSFDKPIRQPQYRSPLKPQVNQSEAFKVTRGLHKFGKMIMTVMPRKARASRARSDSEEQGMRLVRKLGCIPLAVTQAAAYMQQWPAVSVKQYLHRLNNDPAKMMSFDHSDSSRPPLGNNSIFKTWYISFEHIQQYQPSAITLLNVMAFLDIHRIPAWLFLDANISPDLDETIATLLNFSFIQVDNDTRSLHLHPLVQSATRLWIGSQQWVDDPRHLALACLQRHYPVVTFETWDICQVLEPHVLAVEQGLGRDVDAAPNEVRVTRAKLLNNSSLYKQERGQYAEAQDLAEICLKETHALSGQHTEDSQVIATNVLNLKLLRGLHAEVSEHGQELLERQELEFGPRSRHTLATMQTLSLAWLGLGRLQEAIELCRGVVQIYSEREDVGPRHSLALDAEITLAELYDVLTQERAPQRISLFVKTGRPTQPEAWDDRDLAEELRTSILATKRSMLETNYPDHPEILNALQDLAVTYNRQERYLEAIQLLENVLEGRRRVLGEEHSKMLPTMHGLAWSYWKCGRHVEAVRIETIVLERAQTSNATEAKNVLLYMRTLAGILLSLDRPSAAREQAMEALQEHEKFYGIQDAQTICCKMIFSISLRRLGQIAEADEMLATALQDHWIMLSPTDSGLSGYNAHISLATVAETMQKYGFEDLAYELGQEALDGLRAEGEDNETHETVIGLLEDFLRECPKVHGPCALSPPQRDPPPIPSDANASVDTQASAGAQEPK